MAIPATYYAMLVRFDFAEGPMHLWDGVGVLDFEGVSWTGAGQMASVSPMSLAEDDVAKKLEFALSGVTPEIVAKAEDAESVRGRDVWVWGLPLSAETLQPIGGRQFLTHMLMDSVGYSAKGPADRSIKLVCETVWTARNSASFAMWSDRDQQARFPGDRGFEFVPTLTSKRSFWPTFVWPLLAALPLAGAFGGSGHGLFY